jgi:hypothetical protein
MRVFRRKPKERPSITGPDGVEYVEMSASDLDRALHDSISSTIELVRNPAPRVIDLAMKVALPMVRPGRVTPDEADEARPADVTPEEALFAGTAAKLGYEARKVEIAYHDLKDRNESLSSFIAYAHEEDDDWFATLSRVALMLTGAALAEPFPTGDTADLLGDTGLGYETRQYFAMRLLESLLTDPETGGPRLLPGDLTTNELYECWLFGYYLDACEASVPDGVDIDGA